MFSWIFVFSIRKLYLMVFGNGYLDGESRINNSNHQGDGPTVEML